MHTCCGYIHKRNIIAMEDIFRYDGHKAVITILEEPEESPEGTVFSQLYAALSEWQNLKNYLLKRLDHLRLNLHMCLTMHNREQIIGNCNEIEIMLMESFGMRKKDLDLIEEKIVRFLKYSKAKRDGYQLETDPDGNQRYIKDGKLLNPDFRLVDNGVGDMKAVQATREFVEWLEETEVTELDWMLEADIIYPAIIEAMNYSFEGFELEKENIGDVR